MATAKIAIYRELNNNEQNVKPQIIISRFTLRKKTRNNNMNIVKITNGKVELRRDSGSLIRVIESSGAIDADINSSGSLILVTKANGKVELRKESGSLIRTIISSNAKSAKFSGEDILVNLNNGKLELRKESGSLVRTL